MVMRFRFEMLVAATAAAVGLTAVGALPSGYTQLESIEVTDKGQYINTKYGPTADTDIELKAEVKDFNSLTSIYWTRIAGGVFPSFALDICPFNTEGSTFEDMDPPKSEWVLRAEFVDCRAIPGDGPVWRQMSWEDTQSGGAPTPMESYNGMKPQCDVMTVSIAPHTVQTVTVPLMK